MKINDTNFGMGASGPLFFDTGKVKIGSCFVPSRKGAMSQAEIDMQAVFLGHFVPYMPKEKRGLVDRVFQFFAG